MNPIKSISSSSSIFCNEMGSLNYKQIPQTMIMWALVLPSIPSMFVVPITSIVYPIGSFTTYPGGSTNSPITMKKATDKCRELHTNHSRQNETSHIVLLLIFWLMLYQSLYLAGRGWCLITCGHKESVGGGFVNGESAARQWRPESCFFFLRAEGNKRTRMPFPSPWIPSFKKDEDYFPIAKCESRSGFTKKCYLCKTTFGAQRERRLQ